MLRRAVTQDRPYTNNKRCDLCRVLRGPYRVLRDPRRFGAPAGVQGAAQPYKKQVGAVLCDRPE